MRSKKSTWFRKRHHRADDRADTQRGTWKLGPLLRPILGGAVLKEYENHPIAKWFGSTLGVISFIGAPFTIYALYVGAVWYFSEPSKLISEPQNSTQEKSAAEANPSSIVRARMFWGTLPPNGNPAVVYALINTGSKAMQNVSASAWIMEGNTPRKLDERHIGYVGSGEFREIKALLPTTPYGRGLLCISFIYDARIVNILHFLQSVGEFAKYGPMNEMQALRDPRVSNKGNELCQSISTNAAALIKN